MNINMSMKIQSNMFSHTAYAASYSQKCTFGRSIRLVCVFLAQVLFNHKYYAYEIKAYVPKTQTPKHPNFDPTGAQTHDFQITDSTFNVPEMLILTTESSGT